MRSKLRLSKSFVAFGVLSAILVSTFFAKADEAYKQNSEMTMEDLGSFIVEKVLEDAPVSGLEEFINEVHPEVPPKISLPVPNLPVREALWVSDGNFKTLSPSWKRGVVQVVKEKRCNRHAKAFMEDDTTLSPLFQKAQAIVESNCNPNVVGLAGEKGLYQVMEETCKEMGVVGDYRNLIVNRQCAAKLRIAFCKTVKGECLPGLKILAHNWGITGAKKVKKPKETEYLRKVDCAARVLKGMECV